MIMRQPVRAISVLGKKKPPLNATDEVLKYIDVPTPVILLDRKDLYGQLLQHKNFLQEIVESIYAKLDIRHQTAEPFTITRTGPKLYSVYKGNRKIAIIPEQKWHVRVTRNKITDNLSITTYSGHFVYFNILGAKNVLLTNFKSAVTEEVK
jgi:hypothetical protein